MGRSGFASTFAASMPRTKKDTYPLPHMQETMESMVGTRHFSVHGLEEWVLASQNG